MEQTTEQPDSSATHAGWRVLQERLRWFCDPAELPFETTEQLQPLDGAVGQERGVAALEFGLEMESSGFNLFVAGPSGTGRTITARTYADFMPDTTWAISRLPPDLSRKWRKPSVLMSPILFRHFVSGSLAFVSLILT